MTRSLVAATLAVAVGGCAYPRHTQVASSQANELVVITLDTASAYVIDPRTQVCFLERAFATGAVAMPVPCSRLKATMPEAARHITWAEPPAPGR